MQWLLRWLKQLFPREAVQALVLGGPFRRARIVVRPRESLRKLLGLYEHELNGWLEVALRSVTRVVDVGANDGYFAFGAAAAFRRLGTEGWRVVAFEPDAASVRALQRSADLDRESRGRIELIAKAVGDGTEQGTTTLDALEWTNETRTLVKIDVEGAELAVIRGACRAIDSGSLFLIEVHERAFLPELRRRFAARGHPLRLVHQRALPLIGREARSLANWWLVTDLRRIGSTTHGAGRMRSPREITP